MIDVVLAICGGLPQRLGLSVAILTAAPVKVLQSTYPQTAVEFASKWAINR